MVLKYCGNILVFNKAVDMRKQINGLQLVISSELTQDPGNGDLFIFYNKSFNKLKILYFEEEGYCLLYKKLDKGCFKFPTRGDEYYSISQAELHYLLSGLELKAISKKVQQRAKIFY
jgi:transposase